MRWPSSPGHGGASRPGSSFWNFAHITVRPLLLVDGAGACECPQESAMLQIVLDLCRSEHRELSVDRDRQTRVRSAERFLDRPRRRGAREDEAEITGALRQRQQQLVGLGGDM